MEAKTIFHQPPQEVARRSRGEGGLMFSAHVTSSCYGWQAGFISFIV
jgi:hypothetical protein